MSDRPAALVLRALGLGDLLTAVPSLRAVARSFPDHRLILAAPAPLRPLARLTGAVDELLPAAPLSPLPEEAHRADLAVNLHGRGPQSHRVLLAARPRRLIAFANPDIQESAGAPVWRQDEHEVARWCRLLEEEGIPADRSDLALDPPPGSVPGRWRGATVIHPGAASPARRWPARRWAAVAAAERSAGREVVITGSPGEMALARRVASLAGVPERAVAAGRTNLLGLAAVVAAADRVACGDTGVAHLATAFRRPSVVLFGPTPPTWWGPPAEGPHVALWAGRRGDPHGLRPDPGLLEIGVEDVVAALHGLDAGTGTGGLARANGAFG